MTDLIQFYPEEPQQPEVFFNSEYRVRTLGTPQHPLFCAADVCAALGYANGRDAVAKHCEQDDVAKRDTIDNMGRTQQVTYINESGLYALIFGSKLETAKQFKHWVTSEVLPSIRRHGAYATPTTIDSIIADPENGIKLLTALKEEREQRKLAESKAALLEEVTKEQAPKVIFADAVAGSTNSILIGELAKILRQNDIQMGEKRLFQWMRDNGYLGTTGDRYNIPNQRYIEMGLFTLKTNTFSVNGTMQTRNTTKVTGKGQQYFINKFIHP